MYPDEKEIDIFVTSQIGSFKHIKYYTDTTKNNKKCTENLIDIKTIEKDDTITSMAWGNAEQTEILIGRRNQQVQYYDTAQASFTKTVTANFGKGEVVGLGKYQHRLIAALSSGVIKIWSKKKEKEIVFETGGELDRLRGCADDATVFATGGNENELKVWRIGEQTPIFQAKNVRHDWLEMREPVWISDLSFLPDNDGKVIATCSRHGYVRLYDTRAQRRPVCNVEFKSMAATCMTHSFDDRQVLVGFGRGQLHQVDLRTKGHPDKGFKGNVGSVTDLAIVKEPRLVVSVSLDRHIKIHDYNTKKLLHKQYLTSKLSRVLVQTESSTPLKQSLLKEEVKEEDEIEVKSEDEMDELFENMDSVDKKPRKVKAEDPVDAVVKLLKSTEQKKRKIEKQIKKKMENPQSNGDAKKMRIEDTEDQNNNPEDAVVKLLKSTEQKKKKIDKPRKKKAVNSQSNGEDEKTRTEDTNNEDLDPEDAVIKLLKSTERKKRKMDKKKEQKKAKSLFHNA